LKQESNYWNETITLDWRKAFDVDVVTEPLVCFRIIPDKSITNYSNYKFYKDIAELDKIKNFRESLMSAGKQLVGMLSKRKLEGFKVVYRTQNNYVWYEIIIREKAINFYVVCYQSNEGYVRGKLEQIFPHAPIEVVDVAETEIPADDTVIADLKLQRHNFFSIYTNYQEQNQPIEDILAVAEDMKDDDVVKLSVRAQPYDRNYWSYKAEEWETQTLKGKAPRRLRVSKAGLSSILFGVTDFVFHKIGELFRELHEIAFKKHNTNQIVVNHDSIESREVGDKSRSTNYKMTAPVFRTTMKVASHSKDRTRKHMNLKSLSNAFIDVKDTNNGIVRTTTYSEPYNTPIEDLKPTLLQKLLKVKPKPQQPNRSLDWWRWKLAYEEVSSHKITPLSLIDIDYNIMSDKELGKLNMLPTLRVQKKHGERMTQLGKSENPVPSAFRSGGIPIGVAEHKGESYPITIKDDNPDTWALPIIVSGIQGVGKDTVGINWVYENNKKGRGAVILDVIDERDRGMTDVLTNIIESDNLIVLDFAHPSLTPYLDWQEGMNTEDRFARNRLSNELSKFFEANDDGAGLQTERYLRNCVKALPNASLIEQGMILISDSVREKAIKECEKRNDVSTANFWKLYDGESEGRRKQIASPVFNRLAKLIDDLALKPIFGQQPNGSIDFDKWTSEGKVVICKIPKVAFGTGIRTLAHWITVKTWLTKQVQLAEGRKCETILLINEPHQVFYNGLESTLMEIYPEARKHGLQIMTLFHDIVQIPKDLFDIMLSSGANFILYKQKTDKAWKRFGNRITDYYEIDDCMRLNKFEAMVGFLVDVEDLPLVRVKMNDMANKRGCETYDNTETIERCLRDYHNPIDEVEQALLKLEEKMFEKKKK